MAENCPSKYHNFDQIFHFGGLLFPPLFTYFAQIWHARAQFHLDKYIVPPLQGEKHRNIPISTKFSHFGGSCAHSPLPISAKFGERQ